MDNNNIFNMCVCVGYWLIFNLTLAFSQSQSLNDLSLLRITDGWQYRWGEAPLNQDGMPVWLYDELTSPKWQPTQSTINIPGRNDLTTLWLRVKLPAGEWENPTLFLGRVFHHFEVYLEDQLIYKIGEEGLVSYRTKVIPFWHIVPLMDFQNKNLTLKILSDHTIGVAEVSLGSFSSVLKKALKFHLDQIILGSFLVLLGLVGVVILLQRKAEKGIIISFCVFAIANGIYTLTRTQLAYLFLHPDWYYPELFSFHLAAVSLCYFFEQAFGSGYKSLVRRFWQIFLIHLAAALFIFEFTALPVKLIAITWSILTTFVLLLLVGTAIRAAFQGNAQAKVFTVGITALALFVMYDILCALQLIANTYSVSHWGILLFIISMGIIVEQRLAATQASLRASREQLRNLAMHLQEARETERTHIAREIHDELGQSLTGLKMDIAFFEELINEQAGKTSPNPLLNKLQSMSELLDTTVYSVRKIASELRPAMLDSVGLLAAIEWQAEEFQKRTGIQCECFITVDETELEVKSSTAVFRILQESLTNVMRHAEATKVTIAFSKEDSHYRLEIKDNGKGIKESDLDKSGSFGVLGIQERVFLFGGNATVRGEPGKGTTVLVSISVCVILQLPF